VSVLRANFDGLTSKAVPVAPESQDTDGKATFRFGTRVTGVDQVNGRQSQRPVRGYPEWCDADTLRRFRNSSRRVEL
jgi:hypothetical protein